MKAVQKRAAGAGRKPKDPTGARVHIGVSRVASDVAERIAAAPDRVAFLEALVRAAPPAAQHE